MWGQIIGGVASAAGALGSAAWGAGASKEAAEVARDWEKERATHAHQWEVQDLKAAGLNPILSAGGQGAATSGITKPMPDTSGLASAGTAFVNALNTAAQTAKFGAETANTNADTKNKNETNALIKAQTELAKTNAGLQSAQKTFQELKNIQQQVESDNAKLSFWNKQINTAAQSASYLTDTAGAAFKAVKKMGEKKSGTKFQKYDKLEHGNYLPSL